MDIGGRMSFWGEVRMVGGDSILVLAVVYLVQHIESTQLGCPPPTVKQHDRRYRWWE